MWLTPIEQLVAFWAGQVVLVLVIGYLAYHRGRHVQSNHDRRVVERATRRFYMAQPIEFAKTVTYRLHAFGQSGREMAIPQPATAVATPPEIVTVGISLDGKSLEITNRNQTDNEVNVAIAVSAGGLGAGVNVTCLPEVPVLLQLEEVA